MQDTLDTFPPSDGTTRLIEAADDKSLLDSELFFGAIRYHVGAVDKNSRAIERKSVQLVVLLHRDLGCYEEAR